MSESASHPDAKQIVDERLEELLECARCGVLGVWRNGKLVNPGPGEVPPFCRNVNGRPRSHGPFVPRIQP